MIGAEDVDEAGARLSRVAMFLESFGWHTDDLSKQGRSTQDPILRESLFHNDQFTI